MKKITIILTIINFIFLVLMSIFLAINSNVYEYVFLILLILSLFISLFIAIITYKSNKIYKIYYLVFFYIFTLILLTIKVRDIAFSLGFSNIYFIYLIISFSNSTKAFKYRLIITILSIVSSYILLLASVFPEKYYPFLVLVGVIGLEANLIFSTIYTYFTYVLNLTY